MLLTQQERNATEVRLEAIEASMIGIQQRAVLQGVDLRTEWDLLFSERTTLIRSLGGTGQLAVRFHELAWPS